MTPVVDPHRRGLSLIVAILVCLTGLPAKGDRTADQTGIVARRRAERGPVSEWTRYCASLSMNGANSIERILSTDSAPHLELIWSRTLSGPIASAPSIARGKVYAGDWGGLEWALDAMTGGIVATADLGRTTSDRCNPAVVGISSSPTIEGKVLYLAGGDDGFYALDADTLTLLWRRSLGDNSSAGGYYGWCSPALAGGRLLQGTASNCDNPYPRGAITAMDPATGAVLATTYFVPEDSEGGGVWTSPAVDLSRHKIFATTGSAHAFSDGDAFSMVRLDLDTLQIEDRWKIPAPDDETWDADWGSSPTLFTNADGRELVGAGQKDGGYYVFDRNDLAAGPLWTAPIAIRGEVPQNGEGTLSTAAFDGNTLYAGGGTPPGTDDPSVLGAVTALSPDDGKVLWRHTFTGPVIAPVSFANGVVFAVGGKSVVALDAATGDVLWSFSMKAWGFGGVAVAAGRIYVGDLFGTIYSFGIPVH